MDDLVERLRQFRGKQWETTECYNGLRAEAADRIEALESQVSALQSVPDLTGDYLADAVRGTFGERCQGADPNCDTCKAWEAYDAVQSATIAPDGWKLVPIELTALMRSNGYHAGNLQDDAGVQAVDPGARQRRAGHECPRPARQDGGAVMREKLLKVLELSCGLLMAWVCAAFYVLIWDIAGSAGEGWRWALDVAERYLYRSWTVLPWLVAWCFLPQAALFAVRKLLGSKQREKRHD